MIAAVSKYSWHKFSIQSQHVITWVLDYAYTIISYRTFTTKVYNCLDIGMSPLPQQPSNPLACRRGPGGYTCVCTHSSVYTHVCVHTAVCTHTCVLYRLVIYCNLARPRFCDQLQFLLKNRVGSYCDTAVHVWESYHNFQGFSVEFWNDFYKISQIEPDKSKFNDWRTQPDSCRYLYLQLYNGMDNAACEYIYWYAFIWK